MMTVNLKFEIETMWSITVFITGGQIRIRSENGRGQRMEFLIEKKKSYTTRVDDESSHHRRQRLSY